MDDDSTVKVAAPGEIRQNPENPRLVFREKELLELESSIAANGILVPLTVYESSDGGYVLLDGERRWRCAKKLGLLRVPIIVQPEPSLMQNIMMMFAIHNARSDWDPFPTALKLQKLEELYESNEGRVPTEAQLAQLASLSRGEVRRLKNILALPQTYLKLIEEEQELPRADQTLTVDHLLEVTRGGKALVREQIIGDDEREALERALIDKFRAKALTSTVEPRLLTRMARAVRREDVSPEVIRTAVARIIDEPTFTVRDAYAASVESAERDHNLELASNRIAGTLTALPPSSVLSDGARDALRELRDLINSIIED
ncbi:ParB/RepB/Spo0J family partition protein [Leucobacter celer]|uniref:ParB/RepB/Spo0J family partition protein n=1 Tax=Leucobacter celer TaxID=668625 RepID=UPI0006A79EFC|nr:ParB/RepB/Spo0J family partition protein [Leucobacter celer]